MRIHKGDTVCHFKRETLTEKQISENKKSLYVQSFRFCKTYRNRRTLGYL